MAAMESRFKSIKLLKRDTPSPHHVFRGTLQPFARDSKIGLIAANLSQGEPIEFDSDGHIHPTNLRLEPIKFHKTGRLYKPVDVEMIWRARPGLPYFYVTKPSIDDRMTPRPTHVNYTGAPYPGAHPLYARYPGYPRCDICYIAAQDGRWQFDRNTAADAMKDAACWVAAFLLWRYGNVKDWVLGEAPHDPQEVLEETPPESQCPCYSGYRFKDCCYDDYVAAAKFQAAQRLRQATERAA